MNNLVYSILSGNLGANFELRILTRQTARAFGLKAPKTRGMSHAELLRAYARFTADAAGHALQSGRDLGQLKHDLYQMAYSLGSRLRFWIRPRNELENLEVVCLLYKNIGITVNEEGPGKFCVSQCYFGGFYTPCVCDLISAIDKGIFAGIYNGGNLEFCERITEGCEACRAELK